jgi:integrase
MVRQVGKSRPAQAYRRGTTTLFSSRDSDYRQQGKDSDVPHLVSTAYGLAGRAGEVCALHVEDIKEQSNGTGIVRVGRSVFAGRENTTKSDKTRYVPIDSSVMAEIKKHLAGRMSGYVFQTRNGTPLWLSNALEDPLTRLDTYHGKERLDPATGARSLAG